MKHLEQKDVILGINDNAVPIELEELIERAFAVGEVEAFDYLFQEAF